MTNKKNDTEQIKSLENMRWYLQSRSLPLHKHFSCLNPAHEDKRPSMNLDEKTGKVRCHSQCDQSFDVIDLIAWEYGLELGSREAFDKAREIFSLSAKDFKSKPSTAPSPAKNPPAPPAPSAPDKLPKPDFTAIINQAHAALLDNPEAVQHFQARGFTLETIKKAKLGFWQAGYNDFLKDFLKDFPDRQSNLKKQGLYQYIIPELDPDGTCHYFQSEIIDRNQVDERNPKYLRMKGFPAILLNEHYLKSNLPEVVWVVEGLLDCLAVEQAGGKAIALGGSNTSRFLTLCKKPLKTTFVLCMDNDEAGKTMQDTLKKGLEESKNAFIERQVPQFEGQSLKDLTDLLSYNPDELVKFIAGAIPASKDLALENQIKYMQETEFARNNSFLHDYFDFKNKPKSKPVCYQTGWQCLDETLGGGFRPGLHLVGAVPSLGKTTFCLQIANRVAKQIAERGGLETVLYFSLEMSRRELMAKDLSRLTYMIAKNTTEALSASIISDERLYGSFDESKSNILDKAFNLYKQYSFNLAVIEKPEQLSVKDIAEEIEKYKIATGVPPLVFVDYLQILKPADPYQTDKRNTDTALTELKLISRNFNTPIIVVSSFNREGYDIPVNIKSFKETGLAEFASDLMIGLQYDGLDYIAGEAKEARSKRLEDDRRENNDSARNGQAIKVQAKILKNRNGARNDIMFEFRPKFNYFIELYSSSSPWIIREEIEQPEKKEELKEQREQEVFNLLSEID